MTDISKDAVDALLQGVTDGPWREFMGDICANYDEKVIAGIGKSTGARSSEYFSVRTNRPEGGANARFITAPTWPEVVARIDAITDAALEAGHDYRIHDIDTKAKTALVTVFDSPAAAYLTEAAKRRNGV